MVKSTNAGCGAGLWVRDHHVATDKNITTKATNNHDRFLLHRRAILGVLLMEKTTVILRAPRTTGKRDFPLENLPPRLPQRYWMYSSSHFPHTTNVRPNAFCSRSATSLITNSQGGSLSPIRRAWFVGAVCWRACQPRLLENALANRPLVAPPQSREGRPVARSDEDWPANLPCSPGSPA